MIRQMERAMGCHADDRGSAFARAVRAVLSLWFVCASSLACSREDPSTLQAFAVSGGEALTGLEGLFLEVRQGDRTHRFSAADFRTSSSYLTPHTSQISLREGPFGVTAGLASGGDTVALLSAGLAARPRFNWFVKIGRGASNPNSGCFNCIGEINMEIAGGAGERFWLQWGGSEQGLGPL